MIREQIKSFLIGYNWRNSLLDTSKIISPLILKYNRNVLFQQDRVKCDQVNGSNTTELRSTKSFQYNFPNPCSWMVINSTHNALWPPSYGASHENNNKLVRILTLGTFHILVNLHNKSCSSPVITIPGIGLKKIHVSEASNIYGPTIIKCWIFVN